MPRIRSGKSSRDGWPRYWLPPSRKSIVCKTCKNPCVRATCIYRHQSRRSADLELALSTERAVQSAERETEMLSKKNSALKAELRQFYNICDVLVRKSRRSGSRHSSRTMSSPGIVSPGNFEWFKRGSLTTPSPSKNARVETVESPVSMGSRERAWTLTTPTAYLSPDLVRSATLNHMPDTLMCSAGGHGSDDGASGAMHSAGGPGCGRDARAQTRNRWSVMESRTVPISANSMLSNLPPGVAMMVQRSPPPPPPTICSIQVGMEGRRARSRSVDVRIWRPVGSKSAGMCRVGVDEVTPTTPRLSDHGFTERKGTADGSNSRGLMYRSAREHIPRDARDTCGVETPFSARDVQLSAPVVRPTISPTSPSDLRIASRRSSLLKPTSANGHAEGPFRNGLEPKNGEGSAAVEVTRRGATTICEEPHSEEPSRGTLSGTKRSSPSPYTSPPRYYDVFMASSQAGANDSSDRANARRSPAHHPVTVDQNSQSVLGSNAVRSVDFMGTESPPSANLPGSDAIRMGECRSAPLYDDPGASSGFPVRVSLHPVTARSNIPAPTFHGAARPVSSLSASPLTVRTNSAQQHADTRMLTASQKTDISLGITTSNACTAPWNIGAPAMVPSSEMGLGADRSSGSLDRTVRRKRRMTVDDVADGDAGRTITPSPLQQIRPRTSAVSVGLTTSKRGSSLMQLDEQSASARAPPALEESRAHRTGRVSAGLRVERGPDLDSLLHGRGTTATPISVTGSRPASASAVASMTYFSQPPIVDRSQLQWSPGRRISAKQPTCGSVTGPISPGQQPMSTGASGPAGNVTMLSTQPRSSTPSSTCLYVPSTSNNPRTDDLNASRDPPSVPTDRIGGQRPRWSVKALRCTTQHNRTASRPSRALNPMLGGSKHDSGSLLAKHERRDENNVYALPDPRSPAPYRSGVLNGGVNMSKMPLQLLHLAPDAGYTQMSMMRISGHKSASVTQRKGVSKKGSLLSVCTVESCPTVVQTEPLFPFDKPVPLVPMASLARNHSETTPNTHHTSSVARKSAQRRVRANRSARMDALYNSNASLSLDKPAVPLQGYGGGGGGNNDGASGGVSGGGGGGGVYESSSEESACLVIVPSSPTPEQTGQHTSRASEHSGAERQTWDFPGAVRQGQSEGGGGDGSGSKVTRKRDQEQEQEQDQDQGGKQRGKPKVSRASSWKTKQPVLRSRRQMGMNQIRRECIRAGSTPAKHPIFAFLPRHVQRTLRFQEHLSKLRRRKRKGGMPM